MMDERDDYHPEPPKCARCGNPLPTDVENDDVFWVSCRVQLVSLDFDGGSVGDDDFIADFCETCWNEIEHLPGFRIDRKK
jgi:hypothetical protein